MKFPQAFDKEKGIVNAVIETPRDSRMKYAFDEESQLFQLKKLLPADTAFPLDFGFVPHTKAEDGDPLDILVLLEQPTYPGILIACRLLGILEAKQKSKGEKDFVRNDRLLGVAAISKQYAAVKTIDDLPEEMLMAVNHFFTYYHSMDDGEFVSLWDQRCSDSNQ